MAEGERPQGSGPVLVQIHVDPAQGFSPKLKSRVDEQGRFLTPELDIENLVEILSQPRS